MRRSRPVPVALRATSGFEVPELTVVLTVVLASCAGLAACKPRTFNAGIKQAPKAANASEANAPAFDVNDVSVAFPLWKDSLPRADAFVAPDMIGKLVSAHPTDLGVKDIASWRIVAFRYDPIAQTDAAGTLARQLRLVAQPVVPWSKRARGTRLPPPAGGQSPAWTTEDAAFQIAFTLDDPSARRVIESLLALRRASEAAGAPTRGVPLGVHPGLARDGGKGAVWQKAVATLEVLRGRVPAFVGASFSRKPESHTFSLHSTPFAAGLSRKLKVEDLALPVGGKATITLANFAPGALPGARKADIDPTPLGGDSVYPLIDSGRVVPKNGPEVVEALQATLRIDNPTLSPKSSFFDVDCVSCHVATHVRNAVLAERKDVSLAPQDPHRFVPPAGFTSSSSPTLATEPQLVSSVVRSFGYHEHVFTFTERTLNESLEAAAEASESVEAVKKK